MGTAVGMTEDEMRALAYRMHEAASAGDLAAVDEIFATDFHSHPMGTTGIEPIRAAWRAIREKYPELRTQIDQVLVEGDTVAMRATVGGTGAAESPTMMEFARMAHGRIAEIWGLTSLTLR